ncbi:OV-16 antigen isoform X4 [Bemisia tabaci]|uniref:OV-16 antigen isoform X4 n=1 Tax=Bemisia tabaci TaxID=7038 RepID=UPI003B284723
MLSVKLNTFLGVLNAIRCSGVMTDEVEDIKFTPGPTYATVSAALIKETLTKTQIIPDALDKAPGHNANIMWYDLPMGFGKTLAPLHVKYFPTWFQWPHDPNKLYTFVMTDLHRYIVTVFEQPEKFPINFTATNYLQSEGAIQNRTKFSTRKFATSYKLGDPIAVDFAFVNVSGPTE